MSLPPLPPPGSLVWRRLANSGKPVVVYGTGDGADKLLEIFGRLGIEAAGFFASDGFARGQLFHGRRVRSLSETESEYGDFTAVLAFASQRPEVLENIYRISESHELSAPDLPVCGDELFDERFYLDHRAELDAVRGMFCDEESRRVFDCVVNYRLTGDIGYLRSSESGRGEFLRLLSSGRFFPYTSYADLGAYDGDTLEKALGQFPGLKYVCAFEPDPRTFRKLSARADRLRREFPGAEIEELNLAAWSCCGSLPFDARGGRSSKLSGVNTVHADTGICANAAVRAADVRTVKCASLDAVVGSRAVGFIKLDVEGAEYQALLGAKDVITRCGPDLAVSVYHRPRDLFELPALIRGMCPSHRLYLRRPPYIPAWDLTLIAVN